MPPAIRLGTQGWAYNDWVGVFYPPGTTAEEYLPFYSQVFDTVELDTTFYGPPRPQTVRSWFDATPAGFVFAAKLPKIITHDRRLVGVEADLVEFLTAVSELKDKLGPLLVQLPPSFSMDEWESLTKFLAILPEEFNYAVEFRHKSWLTPETSKLLASHNIASTIVDLHYMPKNIELTADFTYIRWLGNRRDIDRLDHIQIDRSREIAYWAVELDRISERLQRVYGYMNNHYAGHSPGSVRDLRKEMELDVVDPKGFWSQQTLDLG